MAFFKNRAVAIGITALVVAGCLIYGWTQREAVLPDGSGETLAVQASGVAPFFQIFSAGLITGQIIRLIVLLLIAFWFFSAIDRARYRSWQGKYRGKAGAPAFTPLVFWHHPGGSWFRRMDASFGPRANRMPRNSTSDSQGQSPMGPRRITNYRTVGSGHSGPASHNRGFEKRGGNGGRR